MIRDMIEATAFAVLINMILIWTGLLQRGL